MLAVVASVVVKAEIARLAALNMAKHPVAARNEVATGFITRCVKQVPLLMDLSGSAML